MAATAGVVRKVVNSAIITIIEKMVGEMTPRSRPMLSTTSSIRPRVFMSTPSALDSRKLRPESRAASVTPPNLPRQATAIATSKGSDAIRTVLLTAAFLALVLVVARPLLARFARRAEREGDEPSLESLSVVFAALLLAALATEWIGIHALFGAFLVGVSIPHDSALARSLKTRLHDTVAVLLLPAFFAFSGLRTQFGLVNGAGQWSVCILILLTACVGKFGGTAVAARAVGLPWRTATSLGVLMNTRGLVELIVLNVGLDLGVIGAPLFAMLVMMALVTTFATSPLLSWIDRPGNARALRRTGNAISEALGVFGGGIVVFLGVLAVFTFIPFLSSTLIAAGMRLIHKSRGVRE